MTNVEAGRGGAEARRRTETSIRSSSCGVGGGTAGTKGTAGTAGAAGAARAARAAGESVSYI